MWTPNGWEAGLFLGGVAVGGFIVGYLFKWAVKDHEYANKLAEAQFDSKVKLWRDKAEEAVEQIREINLAISKVMMASGFKHYSKELMEKAEATRKESLNRNLAATLQEAADRGMQTRYGYDKENNEWFYERYTNGPPTG